MTETKPLKASPQVHEWLMDNKTSKRTTISSVIAWLIVSKERCDNNHSDHKSVSIVSETDA